jgi:hypothetical protein
MTYKKLKLVGASFAIAMLAVACNGDKLTSINKNPNNPEDVPPGPLFTAAAQRSVARWLGAGYDLRGTEFVTQHLAEVQYPDEDRYARLTGGSTTGYFDNPYIQELEDLAKVIGKGTAANEAGVYGPALVLRTWDFSYLTNTWGDIPYFEALKGDTTGGTLSPAYDPQKDIYADFFVTLAKASADMGASASGSIADGDPIYGGDLAAWQRFSNSLRARLALQLVNVDPAKTNTELAAALAAPGGVFTSNADNAELVWPGDGVFNNPWAANFATRDDHRVSVVLMNLMKSKSDPRIPIYAQPVGGDPSNGYKGSPNALTASGMAPYITAASRPGAVFYPGNTAYGYYGGTGNSFPSFLMTYAEVEFILAEAAERGLGGVTGSAASHYYAGITASMDQWGVPAAEIATYLAQPNVVYAGGTAGLVQIAQEKWIALYTDGGSAWSEWRRTCVPATVQPGSAATQTNVPRRFQYSVTEKSVNLANVNEAIAAQCSYSFSTRMYWDKQPQNAPTWNPPYGPGANCGVRGAAPSPGAP